MEPLELALEAYGGQERWHEVGSLDVPVSLAGSIRIARKRATRGKNIERMITKENIDSSARSDKSGGHDLGFRHPNRFRVLGLLATIKFRGEPVRATSSA